ncbi:hemagglutinin repeat-containing protein [Duganella phyllosphaerae]|uniref:hemagglutinin repeat-containing protein n=1 Tax=Duganella phyllosphaerae TaxID=762836 RepID=UPI00114C9CB6|nr:hemagglutinin repeat-containing protein [Duganella phyllosphaerae]
MGSQIASLGGDVALRAGEKYTQSSSEVLAPAGDISIVAKSVSINTLSNINNATDRSTYSKTAIGGSINVPIVDAVKGLAGAAESAGKTNDPRMQALAAVTLASKAQDVAAVATQGLNATGIKVSISLGNNKSESETRQTSSLAAGSTIKAGGDVKIVATGAGDASDLTMTGTKVDAGGNLTLFADDKISVLAAQNTQTQNSKNSSSGTSVGIGINLGGSQSGFSFEFAANKARGKADGTDTFFTNSSLSAGSTATILSGGDTTLQGAVVSANTIKAAIGGDLNVVSLQDSSVYASKSSSTGVNASVCIPPFCYGVSTVGGSASKNKANGDFVSVVEQSGFKAGDGGFQIEVAGNTGLQAGLIASSDKAVELGKNSLVTNTLTTSDLQNKDEHSASGFSVSASAGTKASGQSKADTAEKVAAANTKTGSSGSMGFGSSSGSDASISSAGVSGGTLVIGDALKQEALTGKTSADMIAGLNRDVSSDQDNSGALKKGWDARKMEQDVAHQVAITQAFSVAAAAEISRYADGKLAQSESLRERADKERDPEQRDALLLQAAAIDRDWSEGGKARMLANTAAGALGGGLMGLAGGAAGSAVSGALYHADVPSSMASLPLEQQARIQKMANDAGFNGLTSAADWEALKLVSDLRFDPASQNLPQAEVDGRIRNYLTRLGASPQQVDEVIKTFADAGLAAVGTPRTAIVEQILVGPTSAPTDIGAVDYTTTDKQGVFLGTKVIDKGTQGVGKVLTEVGKAVDSSPVAKFTLEALDFASGPVIYGVNQIPVVEDLKNRATGALTGFFADGFKEAGYDQPASNDGGVGGGAITMVGLGGFAGLIRNAGKKLELFGGATNSPKGSNVFISEEPKHIIVGDEPFAGVSGLENGTISHPVKDSLAGRAEGISGANNVIATARSGQLAELLPTSSLSARQVAIHEQLSSQGTVGTFAKKNVSMADLR